MDHSVISAALGREQGDLLLKNGKIVNVFSGTVEEKDVLIKNGVIARCAEIAPEEGAEVIDLKGKYLIPGLIDAHIHIESSHLTPAAFGRAMIQKGTTAVIADPHEIANAAGKEGIRFMMESAEEAPIDIFFMIPSSVPSTDKETAGAALSAKEIKELFQKHPDLLGLGELMNVPGIHGGDKETLAKLRAAEGKILDGHYPQGHGRELAAYAAAGISSDHECVTAAEAKEKLAMGISLFIREGSSAKNLKDLIPAVDDINHSSCCFCADDICAADILEHGDILNCLQKAVEAGMDPLRCVEMATINTARHYHLNQRGAIAPGYRGDIAAVTDLKTFTVTNVWKDGKEQLPEKTPAPSRFGTFFLKNKDFHFPQPRPGQKARVIKVFPGQLITEEVIYPVEELKNHDIALLAVAERYGKNGNIGYGLVEGFSLERGALTSSVAHDSHNLLILAKEEKELTFAAEIMEEMGGGMAVIADHTVKAKLALPIAGLISNEEADTVAAAEKDLAEAAVQLGVAMPSPFMTLSFLALPVIPSLKLTDKGLFDVNRFDFTDLYF